MANFIMMSEFDVHYEYTKQPKCDVSIRKDRSVFVGQRLLNVDHVISIKEERFDLDVRMFWVNMYQDGFYTDFDSYNALISKYLRS